MVARDPIRKITLDPHGDFDGSKDGAERYSSPHVGSTVNVPDPSWPEPTTVSGTSSAEGEVSPDRKAGKSSSKKKD